MTQITQQAFNDRLQNAFRLNAPADTAAPDELTLAEVNSAKPPAGEYECFSLIFTAPEPLLPQSTYELEHTELGTVSLFLVPIGQDDGVCSYEAVFNRKAG